MSLRKVPTEELLAELKRRIEEPEENRKWCDECQHFVPWRGDPDLCPPDYNPCGKKHRPHFHMPELDEMWGFYRINCEDYP